MIFLIFGAILKIKPKKPLQCPIAYHNVSAFRINLPLLTSVASTSKKPRSLETLSPVELKEGCRLGTDSHAEVTCYGRHARITHIHEGMQSNVAPFHDGYSPIKNVNFADACFAHDGPDGRVYILHHRYGLDFTQTMEDSILCTNQSRAHGLVVDDVPKRFDRTGTSSHSIQFPDDKVQLPLSLHNSISYLPVRYPTDEDMNEGLDVYLSDDFPWDPSLHHESVHTSVSCLAIKSLYMDYDDGNDCDLLSFESYATFDVAGIKHTLRPGIDAEHLAELWSTTITNAACTLKCTDIDRAREIKGNIHRRFKTKAHQRRYKQLGGYLAHFASDTFKSNVTSIRGNKYVQLFCNRANFCASYPIKKKSDAYHALDRFLHEVGVPHEMLTDGALELTMAEWGKTCRKHKIYQVTTEPHSPWQNPAEKNGGLIKTKVRHLMSRTNTPVVLWDYCWEYVTAIRSFVAVDNVYLDDVTPFQKVHGYTPNVSEYTTFHWFDWVEYLDPSFPGKTRLGRWLGPSHNIGQGHCSHILSSDGRVVSRSTVIPISPARVATPEIAERMSLHTKNVESVIGDFSQSTLDKTEQKGEDAFEHHFEEDSMDDESIDSQELDDHGNPINIPDVDKPENDAACLENDDPMIGSKIPLPHTGELLEGTVRKRKRNHDGTLSGTANTNPALDSRIYEVEFPDGSYQEYATNVLVENIYAHVDQDGMHHSILKGIVDHKRLDDAISKEDGTYVDQYGATRKVITTKGWLLKVEWVDGTSSWVSLSLLKESNPLETAQYSKSRNILEEPAFSLWAKHVLKKANRIVKATTHRAVRKKIKFGVTIPDTYEEAMRLDKENGNDFWKDAVAKELKNVQVAFKLLDDDEKPPVGSKLIPYHIIYDVKFDLTRKARLVAGGHRNKDVPSHVTFSSVASRDSVRLTFLLASLNNLNILSADIGNAFLNAPPRERCHVTCGQELFGKENVGKTAIIVRALYGLKTASAAWRHHFATFIREHLHYLPTYADPDVYMKPMIRPDGSTYYGYLVVYVDDILCIEDNPQATMDQIESLFQLKDGVQPPKMYLGTDMRDWTVTGESGQNIPCWAIGSESYLKEAIKTAELNFGKLNMSYSSTRKNGMKTPFKNHDYRPELDTTEVCNDDHISLFQNLIGILRWTCELGRIDILHETSLLSQYLAQPRMGHLQAAINIFYYLKHHSRSWNVMDPRRFDIEWTPRKPDDVHPRERAKLMKEIYPDAEDVYPHNMPEPRGNPVDITCFVDADHAGNRVTRRSHTGIIIFINMAPIVWYSKRQNTVETSTFGSEFIALRIAVELITSLVYKLRMFGVPIEGEARVLCDNESVVKSSSYPESTLKKKHSSVAYHKVREEVAAGKILIYYEKSESNLADLLTKPLTALKRQPLIQALLH